MDKPPYLSLIIPAYNESARLPSTLKRFVPYLETLGLLYEVIVIDDGSQDRTKEAIEAINLSNLKIITLKTNRGKGAALRIGVENSRGELVLISDADGSTPIEEFDRLKSELGIKHPIVIGTRNDLSMIKTHQSPLRSFIGRIFNELVKTITGLPYTDTQCGFKLFKGEVARELFPLLKVTGFAFDVEVLYLAVKRGYGIAEVAVIWENDPRSKVQVWRDPFIMFLEILRIRWTKR
ncbi:MAG: glycosyltransferase family 2 protein [Candidatus Caenarcaniphilales bacterium]|nr:glycosyltransferase family 2 protein [Candidatus Caenarcaniphilales bacterium]